MPQYEVLAVGQPLLDKIVKVKESELKQICSTTGGSQLINSHKALTEFWASVSTFSSQEKGINTTIIPGGSCSNTIKGISQFGIKSAYIGKVGCDNAGYVYRTKLSEKGVIPLLTETKTINTGECICLINEDGERTMRTYLGAASEMNVQDLLERDFKGIKLLHTVGYHVYNKKVLLQALKYAKQNNSLVSMALGSYELCRNFKSTLIDILSKNVDIVICNELEAKELWPGPPEEAVQYLSTLCQTAVVTCGSNGCWVMKGNEKLYVPSIKVLKEKIKDTTGAGDLFASGFLYGYLSSFSLKECARLGCLAGRECVCVVGAEISQERMNIIKNNFNSAYEYHYKKGGKSTQKPSSTTTSPISVSSTKSIPINSSRSKSSSTSHSFPQQSLSMAFL